MPPRMPVSPGVVTWKLHEDNDAASQESTGSGTTEGSRGAAEGRHRFIQLVTLRLGDMVGLTGAHTHRHTHTALPTHQK